MLVIKNSIPRVLEVFLMSLIATCITLFVWIPNDEKNWFPWVFLLFCLASVFRAAYYLFDRKTKILLDEDGVYFPGQQKEIIDWSEIEDFEFESSRHSDSIFIALKSGKTIRMSMSFLNVTPEDFRFNINKHIKSAEARQKNSKSVTKKRRKKASDIVYSENTARIETTSQPGIWDYSCDEKTSNPFFEETAYDMKKAVFENEPEDEDKEDFFNVNLSLPLWFTDEEVTNEMVWISVLSMLIPVTLFLYGHLSGDPPQISISEQLMVIPVFGIFGPAYYFLSSAARGSSTAREWYGIEGKNKVKYKRKAAKKNIPNQSSNFNSTSKKKRKAAEAPILDKASKPKINKKKKRGNKNKG